MRVSKFKKFIMSVGAVIGMALSCLVVWKKWTTSKRKNDEDLKKDTYAGAGIPVQETRKTVYEKYIKRVVDVVLSTVGIIVLSPVFIVTAIAIFITDPGPVIFTQKRVGINKTFFKLYKFRSMKMSTPHDVPTHMLDNPESYITTVGKFIRKTSIDELPQLFNIIEGNLSIIGPRPALWNQEDLVAERDKYCANDVMPGLTGWAQINGRDELEIPVKAKLDGEYVDKLRKNSFSGIVMDVKCFFGTITSVLKSDGVVEGGTGEMKKNVRYNFEDTDTPIGFGEDVMVDFSQMKRVLITGSGSFIGESFENYVKEHYKENFEIDTIDMIDGSWRETDFSKYDTVFHVAGIAHGDVGNVSDEVKEKYYAVNTDLAIETAKKAKQDGVNQFVFMSSMIIYGNSAPYGKEKIITAETKPEPANFYGDSKWQADKGIRLLADNDFNVLVVRPPMIYGKGSKGNYPTLAKLAKKLPVFPDINNQRSMLYIENLCEFLCQVMLVGKGGIFFPQNSEYTKTADMVKQISKAAGKKMWITKLLNPCVWVGSKMPGKIGGLVNKAFGNSCYDLAMSVYNGLHYCFLSLEDSIIRTESVMQEKDEKKKALIVASVASMIQQFNMNNIDLLLKNGFTVDVACNCKDGNTISNEKVQEMIDELENKGVKVYHIPIPRKVKDIKGIKNSIHLIKIMCRKNNYDLMHCHSPIGSVVARIAAKGKVNRVIYTAHGFHFYKGAPIINWLVYFPVEYMMSFITDVLITINKEDYVFAQRYMHAKKVEYVPGIGIDTKKFALNNIDKIKKRKELGLNEDDIMILSVGELNDNKNHKIVIEALSKIDDDNLYYCIAGKGDKGRELKLLAEKLDVNLELLGYRTDISELLYVTDIFAFPSIREGLSVALMEAMACGNAIVCSNIRGNVDLISNGVNGICFKNQRELERALKMLVSDERLRNNYSKKAIDTIKGFSSELVNNLMQSIYTNA